MTGKSGKNFHEFIHLENEGDKKEERNRERERETKNKKEIERERKEKKEIERSEKEHFVTFSLSVCLCLKGCNHLGMKRKVMTKNCDSNLRERER